MGGVTLKNFDGGGGGDSGEEDPTGDGALGLIAMNEMLKSTLNSGTLVEELRVERQVWLGEIFNRCSKDFLLFMSKTSE